MKSNENGVQRRQHDRACGDGWSTWPQRYSDTACKIVRSTHSTGRPTPAVPNSDIPYKWYDDGGRQAEAISVLLAGCQCEGEMVRIGCGA